MLTYVGRGYTPAFVANYDVIVERLAAAEPIELIEGPDDICAPIAGLANAHCHKPSVVERDRLSRLAVGELVGSEVDLGAPFMLDGALLTGMRAAFAGGRSRAACGGCEWSGLCDAVAGSGYAGVRLAARGC